MASHLGRRELRGRGKVDFSVSPILPDLLRLENHTALEDLYSLIAPESEKWKQDPRAATRLLSGLAKESRALAAGQILDFMRSRHLEVNIFHYNAALSACQRAGAWQLALRHLDLMLSSAMAPNEISYSSAMNSCERAGQWELALRLFMKLPEALVTPDEFAYNAAISACNKGEQWQHALFLLGSMPEARLQPDKFGFSAAIRSCQVGGRWQLALWLLASMNESKITPDAISYTAAISACEQKDEWQLTLALLCLMPAPDDISYNACMSACQRSSQWEMSLGLIDRMRHGKATASTFSYSAAISACEKACQWQIALHLLQDMSEPDVVSYNSAISACEKGGRWQFAMLLLSSMPKMSLAANVVSYSAAISACEKCGQWQLALLLLSSMSQVQTSPDVVSYSAAISACEKGGQWQLALTLLGQMPRARVAPNRFSYAAAVSACEKSGPWQQGLAVVAAMQDGQILPDGIVWGSLLSSMSRSSGKALTCDLLESLRQSWAAIDSIDSRPHLELLGKRLKAAATSTHVLVEAPGVFVAFKPAGITSEECRQKTCAWLAAAGCAADLTLVSRLDQPTSGVIPMAFGSPQSGAANWLSVQFAARVVSKQYICLCAGQLLGTVGVSCEVSHPLLVAGSPNSIEGRRVSWSQDLGKQSCTRFQITEVFSLGRDTALRISGNVKNFMLLAVEPLTGRTHQIRAHLAGLGRPLVGDEAYGGYAQLWCPRLFLHCRRVALTDLRGNRCSTSATLPDRLASALVYIRQHNQHR
eukprot:TRINITY_DN22031_c0_g2_i3.p1 TRINITY_DN22031_c0_g2~~TRINITY_DN22031_c0_g2_i3.p1  ORF type:complete len:762 (+),score=97.90 TRINITY_DN22031_c0_g2_i3:76-2361(+)